jgi:hypothetical protein
MSTKKRDLAAVLGFTVAIAVIPVFSAELVSDDELADVRGGFVSAGGINFDFGAVMHTYVDGSLVLSSQLVLNEQGATTSYQLGQAPNVIPIENAASVGLNLGNIEGHGVVVLGNGGATAVVQTLNDSQVRNLVVNTAQGRNISQDTSLTFAIPNLTLLQQGMAFEQLKASLDQAVGRGLIDASGH